MYGVLGEAQSPANAIAFTRNLYPAVNGAARIKEFMTYALRVLYFTRPQIIQYTFVSNTSSV